MKVSYVQNQFEDTMLGRLRTSTKGLTEATLTADDDSFKITITNGLPDNLIAAKKMMLTVDVSKEIAKTVEDQLNKVNPEFVKSWVMHNVSGALHLYVREDFHDMFFSALSSIPNGLTAEQATELQSRLEYNPSQVQSYSFWTKGKDQKIKEERHELMQSYNKYELSFDKGTQSLLKDILSEPVTNETNILLKKTLKGTYSDFHSHLDTPKLDLISHLTEAKVTPNLIKKAQSGEYDNDLTPWPFEPVSVAVAAFNQASSRK